METRTDKLICPLCGIDCSYNHVVDFHREFWDNKFPTERLPIDVGDFNQRFALLGLAIEFRDDKDVADSSKDIK